MELRNFRYIGVVFLLFCLSSLSPRSLPAQNTPSPLPLSDFLKALSLLGEGEASLRWDPLFQAGTINLGSHRAAFDTGKRGGQGLILLDSRRVFEVSQPYFEGGVLLFPPAFVETMEAALRLSRRDEQTRFRVAAIIVDPGHGGKDSGAVGTHTINGKTVKAVEKDITLDMSRLLYNRLKSAYPDKRILMTRNGDSYPSLEDRVIIANSVPLKDNEAIIFISIHANASFNKKARGYEVWYLSPDYRRNVIDTEKYADAAEVIPILNAMLEEEFTTESIMIAQSLLGRIKEALGKQIPSRGLKAEEWFVVRNARMPSVLVELGFVTNPEDAKIMTNRDTLKSYSDALYKGIADFITTFEGSGGFTVFE